MSDTYARVMRPADEPSKRRSARSGAGRGPATAPSLTAATSPSIQSPAEATFAAAVAAFREGSEAQAGRDFLFEEVPAPKRLAPHATAIAATVQRDGADVAWG